MNDGNPGDHGGGSMRLWSRLRPWWNATLWRSRMESQMDAELRFHMEAYAEDLIQSGVPSREALRRERLQFGGVERAKEECHEARGVNLVESLIQDLRYGTGNMLRTPGFTAITVLTLALGIGASTAIFSAVNPILFEPLPYPHASRLLTIWDVFQGARSWVTFHTYREIAERTTSFDGLAVMEAWQPAMTSDAQPERLEGQSVSAGYFQTLGVSPALGRSFQASDDWFHGPKVVILSDALWRRRFEADSGIIGHEVRLDDDLYTVIGVMPRNFENVLAPSSEV